MAKKQKRKNKETKETRADAAPKKPLAAAAFVAADAGVAAPKDAPPAEGERAAPRRFAEPTPAAEEAPASSEDEDDEYDEDDEDTWAAAEIAPALPFGTDLDEDAQAPAHLVPGYDLDADEAHDVAPIGPTEAVNRPSIPPATLRTEAEGAGATATNAAEIEQQIRDLEARLDRMIGQGRERADEPAYVPKPPPIPVARKSDVPKTKPRSDVPAPRASVPESATASEVLSPEFYAKQWGRAGLRSRSEEVDEFGLDPAFEAKLLPVLDFMTKRYFRVEVEGVDHIPTEGRCLVVANHAGGPLPYDGAMLRAAVRRDHPAHRELRWLAEDFVYYLPFVGTFMNRLGAVRACQENAERLLNKGALVAVFPEGAKGIGKLYRDRYRLQRFGRGGFIRLCLRTRTPLVPCAIVGAEEANPMLYRFEYMTKTLGIPYFPITPTFPALGPLGLMPAPTKWRIRFGEPLTWSNYGPEAADDEILVGRLSERVRASIQSMLDRMLSERRSVWLG
ncbi:lysophospholipid acyltransferase family protein [Polyangium jinanense]|uniref:Acyltransferase family protein n=1 Tax=Polyangium jinanense TaxID=2829994 RepID=A0A9X4AZP6_9BACT|nr:lysophospholipid acyltransferase family protein [Polyangium jinanense]MDC3961822.1 acyltransferase family protein [Polyangium jinanense]MDC3988550.1 acyltransferase family protein [Polyangium jinanense]